VAGGALNPMRRGLGTGTRDEIEQLAAHVGVRSRDSLGRDGSRCFSTAGPHISHDDGRRSAV
jgi:hypothetical protein